MRGDGAGSAGRTAAHTGDFAHFSAKYQKSGLVGGGGGIRTHERLSPLPVFKCATIRDAPCLPMPKSIIWFGFPTDDMSAGTTHNRPVSPRPLAEN
jgi:hypothetical protein